MCTTMQNNSSSRSVFFFFFFGRMSFIKETRRRRRPPSNPQSSFRAVAFSSFHWVRLQQTRKSRGGSFITLICLHSSSRAAEWDLLVVVLYKYAMRGRWWRRREREREMAHRAWVDETLSPHHRSVFAFLSSTTDPLPGRQAGSSRRPKS